MGTGESKTTDWNKVAKTLRGIRHSLQPSNQLVLDAAVALCERMAKGELVERPPQRYCDFEDCTVDPLEGRAFCESHQREADQDDPAYAMELLCGEPPLPPDASEREHAWRVVHLGWFDDASQGEQLRSYQELVLRERAAVRAECEVEMAEVLCRYGTLLASFKSEQAEVRMVTSKAHAVQAELLIANAEITRLRERVQELEASEWKYSSLVEACHNNCDRRTLDSLAMVTQDRALLEDE